MQKLKLAPSNSSYSVSDGNSVISVQLEGGAGRYRSDVLGATSTVEVTWICDRFEYQYLRSFFKGTTLNGALPFLIDLILDLPDLTEHKAYFTPKSFKLNEQRGLSYTVSATLEVEPIDPDLTAMADFVAIYNEFSDSFYNCEELLNNLINVELVNVL